MKEKMDQWKRGYYKGSGSCTITTVESHRRDGSTVLQEEFQNWTAKAAEYCEHVKNPRRRKSGGL